MSRFWVEPTGNRWLVEGTMKRFVDFDAESYWVWIHVLHQNIKGIIVWRLRICVSTLSKEPKKLKKNKIVINCFSFLHPHRTSLSSSHSPSPCRTVPWLSAHPVVVMVLTNRRLSAKSFCMATLQSDIADYYARVARPCSAKSREAASVNCSAQKKCVSGLKTRKNRSIFVG